MHVYVWPKGYADEGGTKFFEAEDGTPRTVIEEMARKKFGSWATISHIVQKVNFQTETFSPEYIRMMSRDG